MCCTGTAALLVPFQLILPYMMVVSEDLQISCEAPCTDLGASSKLGGDVVDTSGILPLTGPLIDWHRKVQDSSNHRLGLQHQKADEASPLQVLGEKRKTNY